MNALDFTMELISIAYTLAFCGAACFLIFLAFGIAVYRRSPLIAPRCATRPPEVITMGGPSGNFVKESFGWVLFVLRLR